MPSSRSFSALLAFLVAAPLACSAPASPAGAPDAGGASSDPVPLTLGDGVEPGVAVDASGTAYVAWYGPESSTTSLRFCRLPRGATACDRQEAIAAPGTSLTRPFVIVDGATVRVVSHRYGLTGERFEAVYLFTSTDGGGTFDAGREIGSVPFRDAAVGPGEAVSLVTDAVTQGEFYERAPLDGSAAAAKANLSTDHLYVGAVAMLDPSTPLVVFANGDADAQFRRLLGQGDPNDAANWSAPAELGHEGYPHLASGPSGLFLAGIGASNALEVRKFDGASFGAAVAVPEGRGELPQAHFTQDPAGRLHLVWPRIDVDGTRLYHATSDDGSTWTSVRVLVGPDAIADMRVAVAADHHGVAVWDSGASAKQIRLVPIE